MAKPPIETFGVNSSSLIMAIRFPSLNNFVMFCVTLEPSKIESNVNPDVVPVAAGGPTNTDAVPL